MSVSHITPFEGKVRLTDHIDDKIHKQAQSFFRRVELHRLADWFRYRRDEFAAGELWGKVMRALVPIARYTEDAGLAAKAEAAMLDMISIADSDGDISCVPKELQPKGTHGSDLWERKYVLLGLLSYYHTTSDTRALDAALALARYTAGQVGLPPKTPIGDTGWAFLGMESASILDPVMKLYRITGERFLLDLADYIIGAGCGGREDLCRAILDGKSPYLIGSNGNPLESISKSYEMMSCLEGICSYYLAVGNEEQLKCVTAFAEKLWQEEITYLGSGGSDVPYNLGPGYGEQWNRTAYTQCRPDITKMMECCVTVTYIKLMYHIYCITGDVRYIDRIETSVENALLGAYSQGGDSYDYFSFYEGVRGGVRNFGCEVDGFLITCCSANGPMALGMIPYMSVSGRGDDLYLNLYHSGTYTCSDGSTLRVDTDMPALGRVRLSYSGRPRKIHIRVPAYALSARAEADGTAAQAAAGSYFEAELRDGSSVTLSFDMQPEAIDSPEGDGKHLLRYGPSVLALDKRYCPGLDRVSYQGLDRDSIGIPEFDCSGRLTLDIGGVTFVNYAHAGSTRDETSRFRCWV